MTTPSSTYQEALAAVIAADNAFVDASIAEIQRLMPEGVAAVYVHLNDTPRLAVWTWVDANGADVLDDTSDAYDSMEEVAAALGWHDFYEADNYLLESPVSDEHGDTVWKIERAEVGGQPDEERPEWSGNNTGWKAWLGATPEQGQRILEAMAADPRDVDTAQVPVA